MTIFSFSAVIKMRCTLHIGSAPESSLRHCADSFLFALIRGTASGRRAPRRKGPHRGYRSRPNRPTHGAIPAPTNSPNTNTTAAIAVKPSASTPRNTDVMPTRAAGRGEIFS
jgi:hypothetical protein